MGHSTSLDFLRFILGSLNHAWEFLSPAALQRCGGKEEAATEMSGVAKGDFKVLWGCKWASWILWL